MAYQINRPVVDLCTTYNLSFPNDYSHQDGRETQLIYGENVEILEEVDGWLKIAALEQLVHSEEKGWVPCQGWVKKEVVEFKKRCEPRYAVISSTDYSFGTLMHDSMPGTRALSPPFCRKTFVADANLFLGRPYLWGGRSLLHTQISSVASVDCSGFVNLLYRAQGIHIPRNCRDQVLAGRPTPTLLPGDPLYLSKDPMQKPSHVILKISETQFIESPETGKNVRLLTWGEHIWEKEGRIHFFDRPHSYIPLPRSFQKK